ncbi:hypothetical protein BDC45DRAFT_523319 [Circinella umbellata]|nr:hypothetical protein BDC45DRAFT_523319 [Circinella umbellata]
MVFVAIIFNKISVCDKVSIFSLLLIYYLKHSSIVVYNTYRRHSRRSLFRNISTSLVLLTSNNMLLHYNIWKS